MSTAPQIAPLTEQDRIAANSATRVRRAKIGLAPGSNTYDPAEQELFAYLELRFTHEQLVTISEDEYEQARSEAIDFLEAGKREAETHNAARRAAITASMPAANQAVDSAQLAWDLAVEDPSVGVQDLADLWSKLRIAKGVLLALVGMLQPADAINASHYTSGMVTFAEALEGAITRRTDVAIEAAHRAANSAAEAAVAGQRKAKR